MTEAELVTQFVELVHPMKSAESSVALHVGKTGPSWTCAGWIDGNFRERKRQDHRRSVRRLGIYEETNRAGTRRQTPRRCSQTLKAGRRNRVRLIETVNPKSK
jgi:hypothetical protein